MMAEKVVYTSMESPVGLVWIAAVDGAVCAVGLGPDQPTPFFAWLHEQFGPGPALDRPAALAPATAQLREYFSRIRRTFDLPLELRGTPFQTAVWEAVACIPYGEVTTYGEIAARLGRPDAARAVGAAVGANPLPIVIPCHRVIGADGSLTGYGGGLKVKAALLALEGVTI
jgi:O-6-methylguanine DNA methyltransferase